ncbi:MAG: hypothetical protein R3B06_26080 [Kofleriaceae bacterium]
MRRPSGGGVLVAALVAAAAVARAAPPDRPARRLIGLGPSGRWPVTAEAAGPMLARLPGQRAGWRDGALWIDDIAGEGRPWIGVVERRGDALWLRGAGFAWRLVGALARPRLAGPGYLVWATGAVAGDALAVRRLGVLAPPSTR